MHKHLAGWGIALLTFAGILLPFSQAIALTPEQIQAIVTLVRSFGGDDATLRNVEDSLFGRTPSSSNNTTASRSCVTFSRNFGIGSTGDDVNALQSLLGQQKGDKGVFGEETASLVVDFQGKYGINQTGYVGPTTRAQLNVLGCSEGLSDARMRARDARRVADIKQLQVALELFYDAKGSYPASLSELGTSIISVVPKDPTGNQYSYKALPEGCSSSGKKCTNYHIGASLEGSDAQSLKGDSDSDTSGLVGGFSGADTQPCGGKGAGYCFDITGYVGPVLIPPVPFVSEPYVTVSNASALLGAPIPNSSGLTVGYYYTMAFTLSNKGTSAVYLSNMGRGTDITAVLTPDASSVSYSRDASPVSLSGDMSGVSLIIPAGSTRTLRFSGQLQSEGQTGQVSYQITSLIYGASASNPTGHSVTSGLSNLKISANFGSSSSKPTLTVLSPNGGETYQAGSRVLVRWAWSPSYLGSAVNIGLIGPVMSDTYVTSNWGNVGNFEWVVPSNITLGSYKLKIGAVPGDQILAGAYDESNGYFTITSASSVSRRDTITSYYRELLLREPDLAGLDYWDKGNTPLDTIKAGILSSYEYGVKKQINSLYQELLGRTAEKEGM
ncbi:MAG: DUF4214 domain-containing protein, partial [Candidatus Taylorbacteria bacterium]|nr:DUF4214 domain-containing protein [Candidatus Taylorbacteria bacterium]